MIKSIDNAKRRLQPIEYYLTQMVVSINEASETIHSQHLCESLFRNHGVAIREYIADNHPFNRIGAMVFHVSRT